MQHLTQTLSVRHLTELDDEDGAIAVALKNTHRIQQINTRISAFKDVTMWTSPMARLMRRDWNILSAKLYINAKDSEYASRIKEDLAEMAWVISDLADQVRIMPLLEVSTSWLRPRKMSVQIIHPMTASWLRCMIELDETFMRLICAEKAELIQRKRRHQLMLPCQLAYMGFKATSMKIPLKSSDELMEGATY